MIRIIHSFKRNQNSDDAQEDERNDGGACNATATFCFHSDYFHSIKKS